MQANILIFYVVLRRKKVLKILGVVNPAEVVVQGIILRSNTSAREKKLARHFSGHKLVTQE